MSVGRSYHRTDTAARVAGVRKLLKHLGEVMTSVQFSSADPEKQVHEARGGLDIVRQVAKLFCRNTQQTPLRLQALNRMDRAGERCVLS